MSTLSEDADAVRAVLQTEPTPAPWRAIERSGPPERDAAGSGQHLRYFHIDAGDGYGGQPGSGFHLSGYLAPVDARLIAAAPELLAKLEETASWCGDCAGTGVMPDDSPCTDEECHAILALIAKAEGRS